MAIQTFLASDDITRNKIVAAVNGNNTVVLWSFQGSNGGGALWNPFASLAMNKSSLVANVQATASAIQAANPSYTVFLVTGPTGIAAVNGSTATGVLGQAADSSLVASLGNITFQSSTTVIVQ